MWNENATSVCKPPQKGKKFHHDVTEVPMGADVEEGGGPGLQIYPTTVEATAPLGRKVRIGMSKNRDKKSKRSSRSKSKDNKASDYLHKQAHHRSNRDYTRRESGKTDENVTKATQLAANLSQLLITLPPKRLGQSPSYVTSETIDNDPTSMAQIVSTSDNAQKKDSSSHEPPSYDAAVLLPDRGRSTSIVQRSKTTREHSANNGKGSGEKNQRHHKSTVGEKMKDGNVGKNRLNLASGAALDTLSKSFERLDVINQRRDRARRARARKHEGYSEDDTETHIMEQHNSEKISRRRDNNKGATKDIDSGVNGKEVTIAKVGRFKFSLELNKKFDEESKQKEKRRHRGKHRSKYRCKTPSKGGRKRRREKYALGSKADGGNTDDDEEKIADQVGRKEKDHKRKRHRTTTKNT